MRISTNYNIATDLDQPFGLGWLNIKLSRQIIKVTMWQPILGFFQDLTGCDDILRRLCAPGLPQCPLEFTAGDVMVVD